MSSSKGSDSRRPDRIRRVIAAAAAAILFAIIVIGLATAPPTEADRVEALGQRIRCPVCQNESIADSPSETAKQMMSIVREKVIQGESDREIEQYFIARYGEWVILDPPLTARFLPLWGLPVVGLVIGFAAIARRRRRQAIDDEIVRELTKERRGELGRQASQDLAELAEQVEAGEIDAEVAARLRSHYEEELRTAEEGQTAKRESSPRDVGRSRSRVLAGWGVGVLAMGVVIVMVTQMVQERPATNLAAGALSDSSEGRDLSEVTNAEMEAVIAQNPDVVPMRMALADRYYAALEYEPAMQHYIEVLRRDPSEAEAWARLGWIVFQFGEVDLAAQYVGRSLEVSPGLPEAELYLGHIFLYGYSDPGSALPLLRGIAARDDVPSDILAVVQESIATAEAVLQEEG